MSGKRKRLAYRLTPIFESPPAKPGEVVLHSAAVMECLATGRILSGGGGGGEFLAPEIVDALRRDGTAKVILAAAEYDRLLRLAGEDPSR